MSGISWPEGVGLRRYDAIDSTNEEARRLAQSGERGPLWIVARTQSAGRGRQGRAWISERGNLFASLLMRAPVAGAAELSFAAGLAAAETVADYAPSSDVTLKWPNDVLVGGRKIAGVLLEQMGSVLVLGIGINLSHHPAGTEFPATSLAAVAGVTPEPDQALLRLAGRMAAWYEIWRMQGFAPLRVAWMARAAGLGRELRARVKEGEIVGVFEDLDRHGALSLRERSGALRRITAADVFFGA